MSVTISCRKAAERLAAGESGWAVRLHLLVCAGCLRFRRQLALIAEALRGTTLRAPEGERIAALERAVLDRLRRR